MKRSCSYSSLENSLVFSRGKLVIMWLCLMKDLEFFFFLLGRISSVRQRE